MNVTIGNEKQANINEGTKELIAKLVKSWTDGGYSPSITYAAARNGIVFANGGSGTLGNNRGEIKPDTIFAIASITKLFVGTLIMQLAEEGLVAPTRAVCEFIPELQGDDKKSITIEHLLTHTSGIKDEDIWKISEEELELVELPEDYLHKYPNSDKRFFAACQKPLWKKPGEQMEYCNFGIRIAGEIVCRITGKDLDTNIKERITGPMGLKDTFMVVPESHEERIVFYPEADDKKSWFNSPESRKTQSASGGMFSTALDLVEFGQMFLNKGMYNGKRILSRLSVEAMTKNHTKGIHSEFFGHIFKESGWGLPFILSLDKLDESGSLRSPNSFYHSGAGCTMVLIDPDNGVVASICQCTKKNEELMDQRKFDYYFNVVFGGVL